LAILLVSRAGLPLFSDGRVAPGLLRSNQELQKRLGVKDVRMVTADEVRAKYPQLRTDDAWVPVSARLTASLILTAP